MPVSHNMPTVAHLIFAQLQAAVAANANGVGNRKRNQQKRPARPQQIVERPEDALFCLNLKNPVRKLCINIVEWKWVDRTGFFPANLVSIVNKLTKQFFDFLDLSKR